MDDEKFERAVQGLESGRAAGVNLAGSVGSRPVFDEERYARSMAEAAAELGRATGAYGGGQRAELRLNRRLAPGDPVGSLATDLCETAICEAMPPEEIVRTAAACREAAEIAYGLIPWGPTVPPPGAYDLMTNDEVRSFELEGAAGGIDPNGGTETPEVAFILDESFGDPPSRMVTPDRGFIDPGVEGAYASSMERAGVPMPPGAHAVMGSGASLSWLAGQQGSVRGPEDVIEIDEAGRVHEPSEGGDR